MKTLHLISLMAALGAALAPISSFAQAPAVLLHSIPAAAGLQSGAQLGYSVAVSSQFAVAGAPFDDTSAENSGVVKVFHPQTGVLLHVLVNPSPANGDNFGYAVALEGAMLLVSSFEDDTGATDTGSVYLYNLAGASPTTPVLVINNPTPASTDSFGSAVAISGTRLAVSAIRDDTAGTDAGAVYVYDTTSGTPQTPIYTMLNPGAPDGDYFGFSVGLSGNRLAVGAVRDDTGDTDSGAVYVFDLASGTPTVPLVSIFNPTPGNSDQLGRSLGLSGTRLAVGAFQDDTTAADAGIVHVFDLAGATPATPALTITNPGTAPVSGDLFGMSVAVSGANLVVGSYRDDTGASNAGRAYVYDLAGATPDVPVVTLGNLSPGATDQFGFAVGTGGSLVIVGTNLNDLNEGDEGSASVYSLTSFTPATPVCELQHISVATFDQFGADVVVEGKYVVAAANLDDKAVQDAGTVHVFDRTSATPGVPVVILQNPAPGTGSQLGGELAMSGTRIVAGAQWDDTGANNAGRAYVYDLSSGTPSQPVLTLLNPAPASDDAFGASVAISGNLVAVAAHQDDTGATNAGTVYIYNVTSGTPTTPIYTINNPTPNAALSEYFGNTLAMSGTWLAVGSHTDDSLAGAQGSVYVYDLAGATPTVPLRTLHSTAVNQFSFSLAMHGTRIVVGANTDDTGAADAGKAYVFDIGGATPETPVLILNNPSPASGDNFGSAVAVHGSLVAVSAPQDDTGASNSGIVYIYDTAGGTPTVPVNTFSNPTPGVGDTFGNALALQSGVLVAGASEDDTTATDQGAIYVYGPQSIDEDTDGMRDTWELLHFGNITGSSALDDPDRDGLASLLEMAFGLSPTTSSAQSAPSAVLESGYLTMTITKQPGVSYTVQSAGTLLPAQPTSFSAASTVVLTNNSTTLKVRDSVATGGGATRFMRVLVTGAP